MLQFTTDEIPAAERFDYWREARGRALFGVTIDIDQDLRSTFKGSFTAFESGGATLAEMAASTYYIKRSESDIARVASDSLIIAHQIKGPGWCDTPMGRGFVDEGMMGTGYSDLPSLCTPSARNGFHFRMIKIPLAGLDLPDRPARQLFLEPTRPQERHSRFLAATFSDLFQRGPALGAEEASDLVRDLAVLGLLTRGVVRPGSPEARKALRAAHLVAARRIMSANLRRPNLSVEQVATTLQISVRQLHVLFAPGGVTFMRALTAMRIDEARRLLIENPLRSVAEIAFACGFESLATFYRAFNALEGSAPNDYRRMRVIDKKKQLLPN
ncbi:AraC family transcriptional regulator [Terrarubrum flagellatum]|uniref:AraC family transcriptional regulator n=1 Tax=Terrirubrum flagellatum TaxID=2895980 RepID=UPI0031456F31